MSGLILRRGAALALLVCVGICCFQFSVEGQSQESEWFGAENRWQQAPIDIRSQQDTASPELRAKRNANLQSSLETAREWRTGNIWSPGAVVGGAPEVSAPPHAIWVIAKFESFHVFAADPQYRLIYTEITFRVTDVLRQPLSMSLSAGSQLDYEDAGGRIKKPDGTIASFPMMPERHDFQPGGTYLLAGTYDPAMEYLQLHNWWNLTSGKVEPTTALERERAVKGNSKLSGLTKAQAIEYLNSILPNSD